MDCRDQNSWGSFELWTFHQIIDNTEAQTRELLEVASEQPDPDPLQHTIANLYRSFLDEDAIAAAGLAPLIPLVEKVEEINSQADLIAKMGELSALGVNTPIQFFADGDAYDITRSLIYLWQGGLGLPDRSYYISDNPQLLSAREAYQEHIEAMFAAAGWADGQRAAQSILNLEARLARLQWTRLQNRDRQKIYSNQLSLAVADEATPDVDFGGLAARLWHDTARKAGESAKTLILLASEVS